MLGMTKTESPEQRRRREEREADANSVAQRELARLPARQMEKLIAETVSEETTGDISVYRKYVARRAADKDDMALRKECAAAMKKLKISPDAFLFDIGQYKRFLQLEKSLLDYDVKHVEADAANNAAVKEKEALAAALQQATLRQTKEYHTLSDLIQSKVNFDLVQKRNRRLFGELPDWVTLHADYNVLGWPV